MFKKNVAVFFTLAALIFVGADAGAHQSGASADSGNGHHANMTGQAHMANQDAGQHYMSSNSTMTQHKTRHNFRAQLGPQHYPPFDVDISDDLFVNPGKYMEFTGGCQFVDENGDGICDIAQDSEMFKKLDIGPCMDENGDSICDCFQTRDAYDRMGMKNFVDVDGDGICDNYELNPFNSQDTE